MKNCSSKLVPFLISAGVLLLHFSPVKPLGYGLTVCPITLPVLLWLIYDLHRMNRFAVSTTVILGVWSLLAGGDDVAYDLVPLEDFARTFVLWGFSLSMFALSFSCERAKLPNRHMLLRTYRKLLLAVFVVVVLQVCYYRITGDTRVFTVWGSSSIAPQGYVLKSIEFGAAKANGLYLEPAMLGLVVASLFASIAVLDQRMSWEIVVSGVTSLLSGSAAAILAVFAVGMVAVIKRNSITHLRQNPSTRKIACGLGIAVGVVAFPYVATRLSDIGKVGSSTYYRFAAPVKILDDVLSNEPFGIAFGRMEEIVSSYRLENGGVEGATLDNGWYLIVFHFGWLGVFLCFASFAALTYELSFGRRETAIFGTFATLAPFFTGAIFSPEFVFLLVCVRIALSVTRNSSRSGYENDLNCHCVV